MWKSKYSQMKQRVRLQTEENNYIFEYEHNKMKSEIQNSITDNNGLKEKVDARNTETLVL